LPICPKKKNSNIIKMNPILQLDQDVTLAINGMNSEGFDPFFYYVSSKYVWFAIGALLMFYLFRYSKPNYRKAVIFLIFLALAILAADQICNIFKYTVQRYRPCHDENIKDIVHIVNGDRGGKYGFFSAHAATFFCIAVMTAKYFKNKYFTIGVFAVALLVSYSRIYLGRHYMGDIIVGAIEGTLIALAVYHFYQKFLYKYSLKHPQENNGRL